MVEIVTGAFFSFSQVTRLHQLSGLNSKKVNFSELALLCFISSFLQGAQGGTYSFSPTSFYPQNNPVRFLSFLFQVHPISFVAKGGLVIIPNASPPL